MFTSVSRIFFPFNLGQWHWVLFVVDPNTLHQRMYDSLGSKGLDEFTSEISKYIHDTLVEYYRATMGQAHPMSRPWTRSFVQADSAVLGNAMQIGYDCGLHTCIVAVLIQEGLPLDVLANHPENVSEEMRIRMTLTMARDEWFFAPGAVRSRKDGKVETVGKESSLLSKIRLLGNSLSSPRQKKRKKDKNDK